MPSVDEQDQDRDIRTCSLLLGVEIVERQQDQRAGRADQRQHLQEAGEVVDHEAAAEGDELAGRQQTDEHAGDDQQQRSRAVDQRASTARRRRRRPSAAPWRRRASTISGSTGSERGECGEIGSLRHPQFSAARPSSRRRSPGCSSSSSCVDRGRRHVEHRLRIDAEQDGEDDQRREHQRSRARRDRGCPSSAGLSSAPKITLR